MIVSRGCSQVTKEGTTAEAGVAPRGKWEGRESEGRRRVVEKAHVWKVTSSWVCELGNLQQTPLHCTDTHTPFVGLCACVRV